MNYSFEAIPWEYNGPNAWTFISVPSGYSKEIKELFPEKSTSFGSIRVEVTIGNSTWLTSLFPDSKRQCYVLPLKKSIRQKEQITTDTVLSISIKIVDI